MKKLFTYIASSLLLFSCSPDQPISQLGTTPDIIISSNFKALRKAQKCVVNNNVKVNTKPKKGGFSLETKKKNTFLGKKTVDFFWVNNNESKVLMSKIITLQHVLKAQKLIGFKTQFKTLQLKDTLVDVFFQEGIDSFEKRHSFSVGLNNLYRASTIFSRVAQSNAVVSECKLNLLR